MGNSKSVMGNTATDSELGKVVEKNVGRVQRLAETTTSGSGKEKLSIEAILQLLSLLAKNASTETATTDEQKTIVIEGRTYEIVEFVGSGGFGKVYQAREKTKSTLVAVKIMENIPGLSEEIKNELAFMKIIKKVPIENRPIIECYGSEVTNKNIYIAMELAVCDLLSFWMSKLSDGDAEQIFYTLIMIVVYVLRALAFLERVNIIHGDIKPQNIVVVATEKAFCIKLIDFGTVEKMNTVRAQLTVDNSKPYTPYFVSPEFLKRDKNNLLVRHLHKKSDVWAAGVMFYYLLCHQLPWESIAKYDQFCNDPDAKDVVIPECGGYKLIIELLLKKNPDERSSAKATLLQLKSHPVFGTIVELLESSFGSIDDVCQVKVSKSIREELARIARPGHSTLPDSPDEKKAGSRQSCYYSSSCFRKDTAHRQKFAHPGDSDYRANDSVFLGSNKIKCAYGTACYRTDPEHLNKFVHPEKRDCSFGDKCTKRDDSAHMKKYFHND